MPRPVLSPSRLDEDAAHGLGGGGEEVIPPVPMPLVTLADQPQVGFVNQGGRFQRLPRLLLGEALGSQSAQFIVDEWQQLGRRMPVASLDVAQDASHVAHVGSVYHMKFMPVAASLGL